MSSDSPAAILFDTTGTETGTVTNPLATIQQSQSSGGYYPSHDDALPSIAYGERHQTFIDTGANLRTRGAVLTDEGSFRDDFSEVSLDVAMTGTALFTAGSKDIVGSGTSFLTELNRDYLIRRTGDDSVLSARVAVIIDNTHAQLATPYPGTTGTSAPIKSYWQSVIGTGGSIDVLSSEVQLSTGTNSGQKTMVWRPIDFPPLVARFYGRISARIANQELRFGLVDDSINPINYALIVFSGTDNTKATLRTGSSSGDVEETTITIPGGGTTVASQWYRIEVTWDNVTFYIDNKAVAVHKLHIPNQYITLGLMAHVENSGVPISSETLFADLIACINLNIVQVGTGVMSQPVSMAIGGIDDSGKYRIADVEDNPPETGDFGLIVRPTIPTAFTVSHGSVTTSASGSSYVALTSGVANQTTIINNSGKDIEVRRDGGGTAIPVFDGSYWTFRGITNANQLSVRRIDLNNTQVIVHYELES